NAWGDWDPEQFTADDATFGFIHMKNGAVIMLEATWALNTLDVEEAVCELCGTKAGADFKDGLRINGVRNGRMYVTKPEFKAGSVAFYDGVSDVPRVNEQMVWLNAVAGKGELCVLPEQAATVTRILDAIYESSKTGKPVYFN
ncbi:MAG: gfo/Idh/MocA family oxidoreductase, partial [Clostridia bacterium]|nr:gfo/Idh/MocA family oxidoreductase [Clostridia bacterium]